MVKDLLKKASVLTFQTNKSNIVIVFVRSS